MRQLKFRGKRINNGEWAYGGYFSQRNINVDFKVYYTHFILLNTEKALDFKWMIEVDPETVGQYTGLNDEYGNEIYEGADFYMGNDKGIVSFENGMFVVDWQLPVTWGLNRLLYQIHDQGSADERVKEE